MSTHAKSILHSHPILSAPDPVFATILVGSDRKRFVVHESVLVHYSDFFRAALTGKFAEATEKTVRLEEDDPEIFEFFVYWLYFGRCPSDDEDDDARLVVRFYSDDFFSVVRLYVFADKYGVARLRKGLVGLVFNSANSDDEFFPCPRAISHAFEHLKLTDPMCCLLVDIFSGHLDFGSIDECAEYKSVPFLHAMWFRYSRQLQTVIYKGEGFCNKLCDYHEHGTDEERTACIDHED